MNQELKVTGSGASGSANAHAGNSVFLACSSGHQDAIHKSITKWPRQTCNPDLHKETAPSAQHPGVAISTSSSNQYYLNDSSGMIQSNTNPCWKVPYQPTDPSDINSSYKDIVRINSRSGAGDLAWILDQTTLQKKKPVKTFYAPLSDMSNKNPRKRVVYWSLLKIRSCSYNGKRQPYALPI